VIRLLLPLLFVLLAGCETVSYRMHPPPTEAGRLCVAQCATVREMCIGREEQNAHRDREDCRRREEREYRSCMGNANSQDKRNRCEKQRNSCYRSAYTEPCNDSHRSCYASCGGRVQRVVEQW